MINQRKLLCRWLFKFTLINALFYYLISIIYFTHLPYPLNTSSIVFMILAMLGQFTLFALIGCMLPGLIFILIYPNKNILSIVSIIVSSFTLWVIAIDSIVFTLFHFHVNFPMLLMLFQPHMFQSFDMVTTFSLLAIVFILEFFLARFLWKRPKPIRWRLPAFAAFGIFCLITANSIHAWADTLSNESILQNATAIPNFIRLTPRRFLLENGLLSESQISKSIREHLDVHLGRLNYPLHPIKDKKPKKAMNILFITIDAWRADSFTQPIVPHIYSYARKGLIFTNHYSGGDCTRTGIFSIFYSIPSSYWSVIRKPPVFFNELKKNHYQLGVFFSAGVYQPPFYNNVFSTVKNLRIEAPTSTPWHNDQVITDEMIKFLKKSKQQHHPFFGFMLYDAAHGYSFPPNFKTKFKPWRKELSRLDLSNELNRDLVFNRYKNALLYDDGLINKVLITLKSLNLEKNTIVIISSDHGEEFNDYQTNTWGHATNFTAAQTHVPLVIYWPGMKANSYHYKTSHYDIMPFMLKRLFSVSNATEDYSVGINLLTPHNWKYLFVGSYVFYGVIAPTEIVRFYPGGLYRAYSFAGKYQRHAKLDPTLVNWYIKQRKKYFK